MGKLNFCGHLISRFYPAREIRENLMHAKNMFYSNAFSMVMSERHYNEPCGPMMAVNGLHDTPWGCYIPEVEKC